MRTTFEKNLQLFHVPIEELQIDEQSRDDIPRPLSGLKALYCDEKSRQAVLAHMEAKHRGPVDVKADSFVVETDVEHPVDHRLLSEAVGCAPAGTSKAGGGTSI